MTTRKPRPPTAQELTAATDFQAPTPQGVPASDAGAMILKLIGDGMTAGQPVESMQGLYAIYERHQATAAAGAFATAMAQFQASCPSVPKTSTAQIVTKSGVRYSYSYAGLDEIVATVRPHLVKAGLSFTWNSIPEDGGLTVTCTVRHAAGHEHVGAFSVPLDRSDRLRADQARSAALTVGRRQSLIQALGLVTGDPDTDGEAFGEGVKEPISPEQVSELARLIAETSSDAARFLSYWKIDALADLSTVDYQQAVRMLRAKGQKR